MARSDSDALKQHLLSVSTTATGFEVKDSATAWKAHQDLIGAAGDERIIAYSLSVEGVFGNLRALLGQISGLLILIQSKLQRDAADLPDLVVARERWTETADQLARLNIPEARAGDGPKLKEAAQHINDALMVIAEMRKSRTEGGVDQASKHLRAAYQLMQSICDHRIGLTMIDTSDSCCSCGKKLVD
jgi:hypothetical protein